MKYPALALGVALLLGACTDPSNQDESSRDDSGEIVEGGDLGVFQVQLGDCVNLPSASAAGGVASVESVACDEPHDAEIYELFDLVQFVDFPGAEVLSEAATDGCLTAFEPFVGIAYEDSIHFFTFIPPSEQSWEEIADREVICLITPAAGEPQLTGSLQGVAE